jgi:hypothetical protein
MKATKTKKASENRDQAHYDAGYQVGYEAGFDACIAHIKDAINKVKAKAKEKAKRPKGRNPGVLVPMSSTPQHAYLHPLRLLPGFALGFLSAPVPRIRDLQQRCLVLGLHALRQSPTILCVSFERYNILHVGPLCRFH